MNASSFFAVVLALAVGAALGALVMRVRTAAPLAERAADKARLETELAHARSDASEKLAMLRGEHERLMDEFERLSAAALRENRDEFLKLANEKLSTSEERAKTDLDQRRVAIEAMVTPLREHLGRVEEHANQLERVRTSAYAELREQVKTMGTASEKLQTETSQLVAALRKPQVRGRWGELQLRRVVESAGMVEHVDFSEQETVVSDDGLLRPDLVVRLAGGKQVVLDAKVSISGYLEAMEADDERTQRQRLDAHARHLKKHVDDLGAKKYWEQFTPAPEFVVMFVPAEVFLNAALERDPTLLEHAFDRNVVVATPNTLIAMLRTVAYTWRQETLAHDAQQVLDLAKELYSRLSTMGGHLAKLGRQLNSAVGAYNDSISSMESRVLVSARKMVDLNVVSDDLEAPPPVEKLARQIQAPELTETVQGSLLALEDHHPDEKYGLNGDDAAGAELDVTGSDSA
jgi:DNA recombination protein RmuC